MNICGLVVFQCDSDGCRVACKRGAASQAGAGRVPSNGAQRRSRGAQDHPQRRAAQAGPTGKPF